MSGITPNGLNNDSQLIALATLQTATGRHNTASLLLGDLSHQLLPNDPSNSLPSSSSFSSSNEAVSHDRSTASLSIVAISPYPLPTHLWNASSSHTALPSLSISPIASASSGATSNSSSSAATPLLVGGSIRISGRSRSDNNQDAAVDGGNTSPRHSSSITTTSSDAIATTDSTRTSPLLVSGSDNYSNHLALLTLSSFPSSSSSFSSFSPSPYSLSSLLSSMEQVDARFLQQIVPRREFPFAENININKKPTATSAAGTSSGSSISSSSSQFGSSSSLISSSSSPSSRNLREVGIDGVWSVSSCKSGNGVLCLRDDSIETFWQSDGVLPHYVNIQFQKKTKINVKTNKRTSSRIYRNQ